jgi:protoporphyrinogen oxidase
VEQYVRRNLGDEVFERLIEPFCSGVYAGNPKNLSMKAAFGKVGAPSAAWTLGGRAGMGRATAEHKKQCNGCIPGCSL